jgi:hypothetical protein
MEKFKLAGKKGLIILIVLVLGVGGIGFWVGYDYKAREIRNAIVEAFNEPAEDIASQRAEAEPLEDVEVIKVQKGETMNFATIDVVFISAESTNILNPPYSSPIVAEEGTKFVIVRHKVTNTTKAEFAYEGLPILDDEDRVYNMTQMPTELKKNLVYETISPNVPKTGVTVYRVPVETTNFTLGSGKSGTDQFIGTDFTVN